MRIKQDVGIWIYGYAHNFFSAVAALSDKEISNLIVYAKSRTTTNCSAASFAFSSFVIYICEWHQQSRKISNKRT